jgi:hypothetical protein
MFPPFKIIDGLFFALQRSFQSTNKRPVPVGRDRSFLNCLLAIKTRTPPGAKVKIGEIPIFIASALHIFVYSVLYQISLFCQ